MVDWSFMDTAGQQLQTYVPYEEFLVKPQSFAKRASLDWVHIAYPFLISNVQIKMAKIERDIFDLTKRTIMHTENSLRKMLNQMVFGDGTPYVHPVFPEKTLTPFVGLPTIVSVDRTYAGFDSTTYTNLDAYVNTLSGSPTFATICTQANAEYLPDNFEQVVAEVEDGGDGPDYSVGTLIMKSAMTVCSNNKDTRVLTDGNVKAKWGVTNVEFMGIPIVSDRECNSGVQYILNSKHLNMICLEGNEMTFSDFEKDNLRDGLVANFLLSCQIVCDEPRKQGKVAGGPSTR